MNVDYKLIGHRIKEERKKKGYTQEHLAEKLDVTVGYVSQVERGITKISLDLLARIASILQCDPASFISGTAVKLENYMEEPFLRQYGSLTPKEKLLVNNFMDMLIAHR